MAQAIIRLADICNLKCRGCCGHWNAETASRQMMSLENFALLLEKLKKTRVRGRLIDTLRLDGDREGLCYPHIAEAIKMSKDAGFYTRLISNGTLMSAEKATEIIISELDLMEFSVSGITEDTYSRFQGFSMPRSQFKKVCDNIKEFVRQRNHFKAQCKVNVAMLLDDQMLKNADEYRAGIFYWEGIGVDCVYFTNMRKKAENSSITKLGGGDCANGPVIDANGDIYPCCGSPGDIVICNAFTDSPLDYYEDETAVSLLRALSNPSELPDTCLSCMKNGSPAYQYVHYSFRGLSEYASFKATGFKAFKNHVKTRKVIIFGAGNDGKEALERCVNNGIEVAYVLDNNHFLWRSEINGVPIVGPNVLRRIDLSQFDLLICTRDISDAVKFASELGFKSIFAYALFVEQDERGYSPMRIRYFHFV